MILRSAMGVKAFEHRSLITLPTESRNPPSLILRTARYDRNQDGYVPVGDNGGSLTLPLADDEHVAALDSVGCRKSGLMCTFLVLATRESLTIGRLDIEKSTYEVTGAISLPQEEGGIGECLQCWLADGPTLVARFRSKVVVASERQEQILPYLAFECHGSPKWKADMLEGSFQRMFVTRNQVLCVSSNSASASSSESVRLPTCSLSIRSSSELQFFCWSEYKSLFVNPMPSFPMQSLLLVNSSSDLLNFSLPSDNQVGCYSPTLAKFQLPLELDPCLITCVEYVQSALGLSYKVVFGTSEGRLKCCSHDKIMMEITLEDSPLSVQFAEAAHGVPVLVVNLGGMNRKVVTFFADSLHQIDAWTGVQQVVVDDLAGIGHDQILLVTQPLSSSLSFDHCRCISLLQSCPQNASEKHKSQILKSINKALELRLQAGVKELQAAEQRRSDKMRMLTAACNLMQSIAVQQAGSRPGDMDVPDDAVYMESVHLQEVYMGRCFMIISVHVNKDVPQGFHLRRPTLFATSLLGFVKSMASCLPSQGNSQRFLFSFPLKECHFPLHIILAAEVGVDKSMSSAWDTVRVGPDVRGSQISKDSRIYTQWLHTMEAIVTNLEPDVTGSSGNVSAVCEKWMSLTDGAISQDHFSALVRAVSLQTNSGNYTWSSQSSSKEGERQDVTEEHTKAPLTSMYAHDVSLVSKNTRSTNFLDTLSKLHGPRLAEMVIQFADVLLEEIQSCTKEGSDFSLAKLQAATDRCFCHLLSSITYNSFGHF